MRRTVGRLSDSREILWYDRDDAPVRETDDRRGLTRVQSLSEARWDATVEEWVVVAGHRQERTHQPPADQCPLCPTRDGHLSEVPSSDYDVVVFENRFPSLSADAAAAVEAGVLLDGLAPTRPGVGRCEVVCFTPDHDASFSLLSPAQVRLVVEAWADRTAALSALPGVEQVFPFENRGAEIGVTLAHPHGQVYGYPFVTPRTRRVLAAAERHRARTGRSLFEDVLAAELADGRRVVASSEHWVAFVPAAARWPFEVHLHPRRRTPDLPSLSEAERDSFGPVYLDVLARLDAVYGVPMPYVAAWHQAPVHTGREEAALHLQLFSSRRAPGKLKYLAGSESGMDVFINDVSPERAAELLRGAG